jgi:hypothetical protein
MGTHRRQFGLPLGCLPVVIAFAAAAAGAGGRAAPPAASAAGDPVARLQQRIDAGEVKLPYAGRHGYLDAVLRELKVPVSSQTLVFSKTSLQRDHISPATPRALYFNDDTYLGYVRDGNVLEIATVDPKRGTVFYTLGQSADDAPRFRLETDSCLNCHDSAMTRYTPGLILRSVTTDPDGFPLLAQGTTQVTQETPMEQRWGGWYVTGTHGLQRHMGNTLTKADQAGQPVPPSPGEVRLPHDNVTDLEPFCDLDGYPSRHSDLAALMVLAHQTEMHNLMARAAASVEQALSDERVINKATGRPAGAPHSQSTLSRISSAGEPLLRYLLFCNEPALTEPVKGTSAFAREFAATGPRDAQGRSLRDLDLQRRLLKFPCSYLIYSEQWDALPPPLLEYLYRRLWLISHEKERGHDYDHLTTDDRDAIREILLETKPGLPAYWKHPRK